MVNSTDPELDRLRQLRATQQEKLAAIDKAEEEFHVIADLYWEEWIEYRRVHNIGGRELNKILFPNEDWDNLGYVGPGSKE